MSEDALLPYAIKEDNSVFFLGDDLIFYRLDNGIPRRISTHAIEDAWRGYTLVSDAYTMSYSYEGHKFIVLTFPTANATWVYDISTNLWHERIPGINSITDTAAGAGRALLASITRFWSETPIPARLDFSTKPRSRVRQYRPRLDGRTFNEQRQETVILLALRTRYGNRRGQYGRSRLQSASHARLVRRRGPNLHNRQQWVSLGKIGAFKQRLRWLRLGQLFDRRYRVQISDPVPRVLVQAVVDATPGQ